MNRPLHVSNLAAGLPMAPGDLPMPTGWAAVARLDEIPDDKPLKLRRFGYDLVLFKDAHGDPHLLEAYCPHVGAHLGYGGRVEGDELVCPFHGFRFSGDGKCLATGTGAAPPKGSDIDAWPVTVRFGLVFAWHSPTNEPPRFTLPTRDQDGYTTPRFGRIMLKTHPQETTENSVDVRHLVELHGFYDPEITAKPVVNGTHMQLSYRMFRDNQFFGMGRMPVEFTVNVHGLGYSIVDSTAPTMGIASRIFIFASPIEEGLTEVFYGTSTKLTSKAWNHPWLPKGPRNAAVSIAADLIDRVALKSLGVDLENDRDVWEHKLFLRRPKLATDDGPIGRFRTYARQFYNDIGAI